MQKEESLLPQGEGQDEGDLNHGFIHFDPLTPTLSLRERAYVGQQ